MTLEALYNFKRGERTAMAHHMPRLRKLAEECNKCVEFGIRTGASTVSLLCGTLGDVTSFDLQQMPQHNVIADAAGPLWIPRYEASHKAEPFKCDLLMVDSFHNHAQVNAELKQWADHVNRYLVFHDTISHGVTGQTDVVGTMSSDIAPGGHGIRLAIDELMIRDRSWQIVSHDPLSAGLLVLERYL